MKPQDPELFLDSLLSSVRAEEPDAATIDAAAERVWARIQGQQPEAIRGCADYQALIPDYLAERLSPARSLLFTDHTHECVACRKALDAARSPKVVAMPAARPKVVVMPWYRWAVAAALLAGVGFTARWAWQQLPAAGEPAIAQTVDGTLYRLTAARFTPIQPGEEIGQNTPVRTAKGSSAVVKLGDGTLVEMRERSELALSERRGETSIQLDRGSIIVQAARQHGRLYVRTNESVASVKGTVFAVTRGMKGSRVAVIEGEVHVDQNNTTHVLRAGDQVASNGTLAPVSIAEEISWSRDQEKYAALLREFAEIGKKIEALPGPALRYSSNLLSRLPAGTVFYAGIPNLGVTLEEAGRIFSQRLTESPVLRDWWAGQRRGGRDNPEFDRIVRELSDMLKHLGDEVVIYFAPTGARTSAPVALAEVRAGSFRQWLENQIRTRSLPLRIVESPAELAAAGRRELPILLTGNFVAASPRPEALQALVAGGGFAGTPFYSRLAESYSKGAGWLFGLDLERMISTAKAGEQTIARTGFPGVRYLVVERRERSGKAEHNAVLSFTGERRGIASWLAAPAPIGALDFVSPDANAVTAVLAKNPQAMVDDLLAMFENVQRDQAELQAATGVNLRADLAGPLSGELVVAFDGAVLPLPEWIAAAEVYDTGRLQGAIEKMAAAVNQREHSRAPLRIESQTVNGQMFYTLRGLPVEVHYTYTGGYLLAGANRPSLTRAMQNKLNGYSLTRSQRFTALVPRDGHANFSAMFYQNVAGKIAGIAETLSPQMREALGDAAKDSQPTLVLAYGDADRISLASRGDFFGINPANMLMGLPGGSLPIPGLFNRKR
jgi:ferric-dicitrate binding protein FerR (iron transport regulator)